MNETVSRPSACPTPGQIPAFDAGWNAHEKGLERETVRVMTPTSGRKWALMAWDIREKIVRG